MRGKMGRKEKNKAIHPLTDIGVALFLFYILLTIVELYWAHTQITEYRIKPHRDVDAQYCDDSQ